MKAALIASSLFIGAVSAFTGRATFYSPGSLPGVCGQVIADCDFVVAVNTDQFSSSLCGTSVQITSGSKSTIAVIKDSCPSCGTNNVDLTKGLFEFFAPLETGLIPVTWELV